MSIYFLTSVPFSWKGHRQPPRYGGIADDLCGKRSKIHREFGDIDERFYNSVESALEELFTLLHGETREMYPQFRDRLARVERMTDGIGWGFHDFVGDVVGQLEEELGGR